MRILLVLALIFCFGCSDDSTSTVDAGVEASVQDAAVEAAVEDSAPEASADLQLDDVAAGEAAVEDAQSE